VRNRKATLLRQWKCFYPELARLTMKTAYASHSSRNTSSLLLRLDVIWKFGLQFEFSGWIPDFRIDRITLSFKHIVPDDDPFMVACAAGDVNLVQELLLKYPASPHYRDTCEQSPLGVAIAAGHSPICKLLIDSGANTDSTFGMFHTLTLSCALRCRNLEITRLLIAKGAHFDHTNAWGWSPLFYLWADTVQQEQASEFIDLLRTQSEEEWQCLHRGVVDDAGWMVLARCAVFGTPEDMLTLIRYGVDPTEGPPASGWTALHFVVQYGVEDSFFSLLPWFRNHGGVDLPDFAGWTLLHLAVENGNLNIIRHLLQNGADWRAKTLPSFDNDIPESLRGRSVSTVQIAASCGDQRYVDFLDILDELGLLDDEDADADADAGDDEDVWADAMTHQP
jgi:ankyrin repeat protein